MPRGYDRRADALREDELVRKASAVREAVLKAVRETPEHADFIRHAGAAASLKAAATAGAQ